MDDLIKKLFESSNILLTYCSWDLISPLKNAVCIPCRLTILNWRLHCSSRLQQLFI